MQYDVVIAGGSVAGLFCAREIAASGFSVLVIEEDYEIGTPEHCGGLVSVSGLDELGIIPFKKTFEHIIDKAVIHAPDGTSITIDSKKQKVAEINRREFDKQIAHQAQKNGARIKVRCSLQEILSTGVRTSEGEIGCKIVVDARGVASLANSRREGIMSSAQYEIYADWIEKGKVEVFFDNKKYPGFFAWIIPSGEGRGKIGVAGRAINAAIVIDEFLEKRKEHSVIRKIFAPIWVDGPIKNFVKGNLVIVGDAAGQAKPTTAGGIFSCGMAGIYAGQAIGKYLKTGNPKDLEEYQSRWNEKFGGEFERQLFVRKLLQGLDNSAICKLFHAIKPEVLKEISDREDFDFHTGAIIKMLGIKGSIKSVSTVLGAHLKKFLN